MKYSKYFFMIFFIGTTLFILVGCSQINESNEKITINVVNEAQQQAGRYVVAWNQKDNNGENVTAGSYNVKIESKNLHVDVWNTYFNISPSAKHFPTSDIGSNTMEATYGYFLNTNSSIYAVGDTVLIFYELPQPDENVKVFIVK